MTALNMPLNWKSAKQLIERGTAYAIKLIVELASGLLAFAIGAFVVSIVSNQPKGISHAALAIGTFVVSIVSNLPGIIWCLLGALLLPVIFAAVGRQQQKAREQQLKAREELRKWEPCSHGVSGGKNQNLCGLCIQEQKEVEEKSRREQELRDHQERIDSVAVSLQFEEQKRLGRSVVPSIDEFRRFTPQRFEDEIANMFRRLGYAVEQTPYVKDHGRDAILNKDGKKFMLECKKYGAGNLSGRRDLQILYAEIERGRAHSGFFVTTGGFTRDAIEYAPAARINLVGPDDLVRMMFDSKPDAGEDRSYRSMCRQCEEIVYHQLEDPQSVRCRNGHEVAPTLDFEAVLSASSVAANLSIGVPRLEARRPPRKHDTGRYPKNQRQKARVAIIGNTYPVKDQLKNLGGRWSPEQAAWMVPADTAAQAKALVAGAPTSRPLAQDGRALELARLRNKGEQWVLDRLALTSAADTTPPTSVKPQGIRAGDRTVIRYLDDNKTATYTLSDTRNDPTNGMLSITSPLGKQLIGLVEGDDTEFEVGGRVRPVSIVRVIATGT